jgi:predicted metalloprotease with PDZ domain
MIGDEIIAVNGLMCSGELDKWLQYFESDLKKVSIVRAGRLLEMTLPEVNRFFYSEYTVVPIENPIGLQKRALEVWMR